MKQRSPQRIVKSLKNLRDYLANFSIGWTSNPLASKIDECIYGEHTEDSINFTSQDTLNIDKTKERSPQKIVKNLLLLRKELEQHQMNYVVSSTLTHIQSCLTRKFNFKRKEK